MRTTRPPNSIHTHSHHSTIWWRSGLWSLRLAIVALLALLATDMLFSAAITYFATYWSGDVQPSGPASTVIEQTINVYCFLTAVLCAAILIGRRPLTLVLFAQILLFGGVITTGLAVASQITDYHGRYFLMMTAIGGLLSIYWIAVRRSPDS